MEVDEDPVRRAARGRGLGLPPPPPPRARWGGCHAGSRRGQGGSRGTKGGSKHDDIIAPTVPVVRGHSKPSDPPPGGRPKPRRRPGCWRRRRQRFSLRLVSPTTAQAQRRLDLLPTLPHSIPPTLPHSIQPTLTHSIQPTLPYSIPPTLPHSIPPRPSPFNLADTSPLNSADSSPLNSADSSLLNPTDSSPLNSAVSSPLNSGSARPAPTEAQGHKVTDGVAYKIRSALSQGKRRVEAVLEKMNVPMLHYPPQKAFLVFEVKGSKCAPHTYHHLPPPPQAPKLEDAQLSAGGRVPNVNCPS